MELLLWLVAFMLQACLLGITMYQVSCTESM